jgi:predicted glycosyltransferase involved in capsule biosynthesis
MIESQDIKYSIIISYRDREEHLSILLPRLKDIFIDESYEIIIAEQDNNEKFQNNSLYNIAAQKATGEIFIFHDVDYYPSDNVDYYTTPDIPLYPVRNLIFLNQEGLQRDFDDIPEGYRDFHQDVGDHSGGVFVLHRELFYKMNGLNPYYKGWGKEDDDTRDRLRLLGYNWKRNSEGLFYALYHEDNKPDNDDIDFINNHILLNNIKDNINLGYKQMSANVEKFEADINIIWLKINNFKYD